MILFPESLQPFLKEHFLSLILLCLVPFNALCGYLQGSFFKAHNSGEKALLLIVKNKQTNKTPKVMVSLNIPISFPCWLLPDNKILLVPFTSFDKVGFHVTPRVVNGLHSSSKIR